MKKFVKPAIEKFVKPAVQKFVKSVKKIKKALPPKKKPVRKVVPVKIVPLPVKVVEIKVIPPEITTVAKSIPLPSPAAEILKAIDAGEVKAITFVNPDPVRVERIAAFLAPATLGQTLCPVCKSTSTVAFSNGTKCNQCGNQF